MLRRKSRKALLCGAIGVWISLLVNSVSADPKEFNASIWTPDTTSLTKFGYVDWTKDLERVSNGALKPKLFIGSVLLPPAAHLSGLRDGIAQVAYHAGTYTPAELPRDNVLAQLAFSYSDYFVVAFAVTEINMTDPELLEQWASQNIVYGGGYATIPYRLFCTTKVTSLADIKGKKVRMPGSVHSDWAKSVGAIPVNVPSTEMYNGLDKGQLDCASNTMEQLKASSLWEVAKHTTMVELGMYYAGFEYGINKDFWKSLTPEERRFFFDTIATAMVKTGIGYAESGKSVAKEAKKFGVTFHAPDNDLERSISDFTPTARATAIELGVEKFGVQNSEDLIRRFEAMIEKWRNLLDGIERTDEDALIALVKKEIYDKIDENSYGTN